MKTRHRGMHNLTNTRLLLLRATNAFSGVMISKSKYKIKTMPGKIIARLIFFIAIASFSVL
jgi:hypothetical protein